MPSLPGRFSEAGGATGHRNPVTPLAGVKMRQTRSRQVRSQRSVCKRCSVPRERYTELNRCSSSQLYDHRELIDQNRFAEIRNLLGSRLNALVDTFDELGKKTVQHMRAALDQGDGTAVAKGAHRLKGGAANLGAAGLAGLCAELETAAQTTAVPVSRLDELAAAQASTCAQLRRLLSLDS